MRMGIIGLSSRVAETDLRATASFALGLIATRTSTSRPAPVPKGA